MSSQYSLSDVFNECLHEKQRAKTLARGQTDDAKQTIYVESWKALNTWIETRICKKKGAEVPMLGTFSWETKIAGDGRVFSRPIFVMSESFIKDHKVRRQRVHMAPNIEKGQEINYSQLAIKFSKNLTKDMVFSGSRDIIKKIGDYVDRSYDFEIEFSFGTLKSRERKVRFEFNQTRLAQILPESMRIGTLPQEEAGAYDEEASTNGSMSENQNRNHNQQVEYQQQQQPVSRLSTAPLPQQITVPKLSLKGATTGKPSSAGNISTLPSINNNNAATFSNTADNQMSQGQEDEPRSQGGVTFTNTMALEDTMQEMQEGGGAMGAMEEESGDAAMTNSGRYLPHQDRMLSPRLVELMAAMEESLNAPAVDKVELRNRAKERVEEMAYLKSLDSIEKEAEFEEKITLQAEAQAEEWEHITREKVDDFHNKTRTINGWLHDQMADNKEVSDKKLALSKQYTSSFFLPDNAGNVLMPSGSVPGGQHKSAIKQGLRKDLKYQIKSNADKAVKLKALQLEEERDYLDQVAMEMDLEAISDRAAHLEKQKALLESWERDAHIRNLKKLQLAGANAVKDYVYVNLPEAEAAKTKTTGFNSVGFDTRTGKL